MGYAQPAYTPPSLRMLPPDSSAGSPLRLPRGRKALVSVIFVGLIGLAYLCALVRVSELDLACQHLREQCRKTEADIGNLAITHAALIDGSKIDRIIEEKNLERPVSRETASVSPELCPDRDRFAGAYRRGEAASRGAWADMNGTPRW